MAARGREAEAVARAAWLGFGGRCGFQAKPARCDNVRVCGPSVAESEELRVLGITVPSEYAEHFRLASKVLQLQPVYEPRSGRQIPLWSSQDSRVLSSRLPGKTEFGFFSTGTTRSACAARECLCCTALPFNLGQLPSVSVHVSRGAKAILGPLLRRKLMLWSRWRRLEVARVGRDPSAGAAAGPLDEKASLQESLRGGV